MPGKDETMFSRKPSRSRPRRAHLSALVAVSLIAVIGFGALTLDGGMQYRSRRRVQAATDAAALAAAVDLYKNYATNSGTDPSGTARQSAVTTATALGYPNSGNSTVTVNIPPLSGLYVGSVGYAEVIISSNQTSYFSALWGNRTLSTSARAVSRGKLIPGNQGIIILDPTISDSLEIDGKLTILNQGHILVNSTDAAAVQFSNVANLVAGEIDVVGTPGVTINKGGVNGAAVKPGVTPVSDPLAAIPEPNPATQTYYGSPNLKSNTTLQPGAYQQIQTANNIDVIMAPGVYTIGWNGKSAGGGGIQMGTGATLTGTGVMIYNLSGDSIKFDNAGPINLTAPTSGPYTGISFFQPRSVTQEIHLRSLNNITMSGTFYAQTGEFDFRPNGTAVFNMGQYICDQMEACQGDSGTGDNSTGTVILNPGNAAPTQRVIQLVE
jgi:hypothetical protein